MPVQAESVIRRKPLPLKRINEKIIEDAYNSTEDVFHDEENPNSIRVRSSISDEEVKLVEASINWGSFNMGLMIDKMVKFSVMLTGMELYPYQLDFQKRVFESVLMNDGDEITALFSRQSGKTECIACTVVTLMVLMPILAEVFPDQLGRFSQGIHIGLFAPVSEQALTTHTRMDLRLSTDSADAVLSDGDINAKKKYNGGMLKVEGGTRRLSNGLLVPRYTSYCRVQSAAKQTKIESKTYHLVILEEAQDLDTMKVQKSIHPTVAAYNGTIVKIGTPLPVVSDFYHACQRGVAAMNKRQRRNHFEYDYRVVQKYNAFYKAFIQKEKDRLGEDSDAFRLAYKLEWLLEKGMALTMQMFEEYMQDVSARYEYEAQPDCVYVAGLDLARKDDSSVLTIARIRILEPDEIQDVDKEYAVEKTIVNWVEMTGELWESQFEMIMSFVDAYSLKTLAVDATGKGDPIAERLAIALQNHECTVLPVVFSTQSKHEMATLFYQEMRSRRIVVPGHASVKKTRRFKNFLQQFLSCEKVYHGKFMALQHGDAKGSHDDYVDSLLLLCYGVEQNQVPVAQGHHNVFLEGLRGNSRHSVRFDRAMSQLKNRSVAKWRRTFK